MIGASHPPSTTPSTYPSKPLSRHDENYLVSKNCESLPPPPSSPWSLRGQAVNAQDLSFNLSIPDLEDTDDDCTTVSSCSSSVQSRSTSASRGSVTFATQLVTDVRTRPRTRPQDVKGLFYSCEETQRFRQEYRLERERYSSEDSSHKRAIGESKVLNQEESKDKSDCCTDVKESILNSLSGHRISRVVVMHKDTLETFIDKDLADLISHYPHGGDVKTANDDFFDNDSFWSGQITWY